MIRTIHHRMLLRACVCALALVATPARAQMPVIDPANLAQSVIQAAHALEQIHNQITQIEQQTRMLAQNPLDLSPELSDALARSRALFDTAERLAFDIERVSAEAADLYPETWQGHDLDAMRARAQAWLREDRAAIERSLRAEAQARVALEARDARLGRALQASRAAQGQTSAIQASNQILAVSAAQLADIERLLVIQSRTLSTERMERIARETRALEMQRRAFPQDARKAHPPARSAFKGN